MVQPIEIEYAGEEDFFYLYIDDKRLEVDWSDLLNIRDKVNALEKELEE